MITLKVKGGRGSCNSQYSNSRIYTWIEQVDSIPRLQSSNIYQNYPGELRRSKWYLAVCVRAVGDEYKSLRNACSQAAWRALLSVESKSYSIS